MTRWASDWTRRIPMAVVGIVVIGILTIASVDVASVINGLEPEHVIVFMAVNGLGRLLTADEELDRRDRSHGASIEPVLNEVENLSDAVVGVARSTAVDEKGVVEADGERLFWLGQSGIDIACISPALGSLLGGLALAKRVLEIVVGTSSGCILVVLTEESLGPSCSC